VRRLAAVLALSSALFAASAFAGAIPASAHPLGNFTINRYCGIVLSPGRVRLMYVVDMAEIPTFQETPAIDTDGDGQADEAESTAWAYRMAPGLAANLSLSVDGRAVPLTVADATMVFRRGQAGLPILRLQVDLGGAVAAAAGTISYRDGNYGGRIGWKEITARSENGVALTGSSVPTTSVSRELFAYPSDMLSSPLDITGATVTFRPGHASAAGPSGKAVPTVAGAPVASGGAFAALVTRTGMSVPVLVLSLLIALAFGGLHSMGPGHGKTILAAYLVGAGARFRTVAAVGIAVSLMHTASVLALGAVTLYASRSFPPDRVYPWLGVISGAIVVALGGGLLVVRSRAGKRGEDRWHPHAHPHEHGDERSHQDLHAVPDRAPTSRRGLLALAVSGGILPSPTALVVLLASIALHRLAYGLLLIGMFSVGLAAALTGVGLLALRARSLVSTRLGTRAATLIPIASAAVILMAGLVLTTRAVVQVV
jgi:ABC-type nickel/cobalt efflux system permease component RcnA